MDEDDLGLSIPLKPLLEEFSCPICFTALNDIYMTPCGHNFCKACLLECLNRKHVCPCCNKEVEQKNIIKNHHLDKILSIVYQEKEISTKAYFEKLLHTQSITSDSSPSSNTNNNSNDNSNNSNNNKNNNNNQDHSVISTPSTLSPGLTPIEEVLQKHLKRGLTAYQDYLAALKSKLKANETRIRADYASKMMRYNGVQNEQTEKLRIEYESKLNELQKNFHGSIDSLIQAYDGFLSSHLPEPRFLPVTINIRLETKNITLERVVIQPTDTLEDLRRRVTEKLENIGNPLENNTFSQTNVFVLLEGNSEIHIREENKPIVQYRILQGSDLLLKGELKLKSDRPVECFTASFKEGNVVDYFTCQDCKFNWICRTCAQNCHQGHNIVEYIREHKPTWPCCYCVKNRKCKILNNKNKNR